MNYLFFVDLFCLVFVSVLFPFVLYFICIFFISIFSLCKNFPDWPFLRNKTEIWVSRFFLRCSHTWPLCSTSSTPSCLPSDGNLSRCLVLMWSAPELDSQMKTKKKPWRTQMIEISSLVFCFCWRRRTRTRSEMDHHSRGENIGRKPPDLDRKSTSSWPGSHFSVDRATFFDQNHVSLTSITFFTIRITFLQIESGQRSCGEDYGLLISPQIYGTIYGFEKVLRSFTSGEKRVEYRSFFFLTCLLGCSRCLYSFVL